MSKSKNHTVKIVVYNRLDNGRMSIGVKGRYGGEVLGMFTTGLIIKEKAWDTKERFIKDSYEKDFQPEYNRLKEIKEKVREARNMLATGDLFWTNVEDYVMKRPVKYEDQSVLEFAKEQLPTIVRQYSTMKKHCQNISAVQNKILPKEYNPLMFSHLQDGGIVKQINDLIIKSTNKATYKRQQLLSIQLMWRKKNGLEAESKLFSKIPSENKNPIPKDPVTNNQILEGFTEIENVLHLEAFTFWLYSMSLMGLDGVDLVNLDESNIVGNKKNMHVPYHPSLDREDWGMGKKSHIKIVRAKSRVRDNKDYITITRLGNLLPTYYLRMLLKHCISITKPHLAYKGKDCLRLFNFTTRDKNRMQIPEGVDKWKEIRYSYTRILKQKMGATVQFTRATSAELALQLGATEQSVDTFLGHANEESKRISKSGKHYISENQLKVDTDHIFMLVEFEMNKKIDTLIDMHKDKTEIVNNEEHMLFPLFMQPKERKTKDKMIRDTLNQDKWFRDEIKKGNPNAEKLVVMDHFRTFWLSFADPLSSWTKGEELEFQRYQLKYNKVIKVWSKKFGKLIDKRFTEKDYDDRFKELIKRKYGKQDEQLDEALKMYKTELYKQIREYNKLQKEQVA